jgi:hypothetical protein
MSTAFNIKWIDRGVEPRQQPDPRYPLGIDLDLSNGAAQACTATLPYPAPRIGYYVVECKRCGCNVLVTTAGRVDDPRSVKLACKNQAETLQ